MWELDREESWAQKNWCFWTVMLEKTLESNLDCQEIQPVHPKGNQSWMFIGRNNAEAETPILWPPDVKNHSLEKTLMLEKIEGGKEGDDRRWDGWMVGLTQWPWVWVGSLSWWWTGGPSVLWFMRSERVGHDWGTELNWTELNWTAQHLALGESLINDSPWFCFSCCYFLCKFSQDQTLQGQKLRFSSNCPPVSYQQW